MNIYEVTYTYTFYETVTVEAPTADEAIKRGRNMEVEAKGDPVLIDHEANIITRDWQAYREAKSE